MEEDFTFQANPTEGQPKVFDYAQSNQLKLYFPLYPTMQWFVTMTSIPGLSMGQTYQPTPFTDVAMVGDKIQYDPFSMTFMVDQHLNNYMEMYNWIKNIGFPNTGRQFNRLERPDYTDRKGDRNLYSDILLSILNSHNNVVTNVHIYESFPVALSAIEYNQQDSDTNYATCDVTFMYSWFDVVDATTMSTADGSTQ